jgi:hypothetical protein
MTWWREDDGAHQADKGLERDSKGGVDAQLADDR